MKELTEQMIQYRFPRWEELPQLEVVGVVLTGPRTARVRPTEEEEKERLREKLETMIRF